MAATPDRPPARSEDREGRDTGLPRGEAQRDRVARVVPPQFGNGRPVAVDPRDGREALRKNASPRSVVVVGPSAGAPGLVREISKGQ